MAPIRVLIVEDEALIAEEIQERLARAGYVVTGAVDSGATAIERAASDAPDIVLMDIRLKGAMDGVEAANEIYERFRIPIVYLTAHSDQATLQRAKTTAAFGYVLKPFQVDNLIAAIELGIHRSQVEARLQEHQLTYATILGGIADAVIATDLSGRVRFMNGVAEQLTGWSSARAEGRALEGVVRLSDEAGRPSHESLVRRVAQSRQPVRFGVDQHLARAGGATLPVDGGAAPVIDYLGRVVGVTVTLRDASAARQAERSLRALSDELQAVVETAVDGVLLLESDGTVRVFNAACERLFGYARAEIIGRDVGVLIASPLPGARPADPGSEAPPPVPLGHARTLMAHRKDGGVFPVEVSLGEASRDGRPVYVAVVHDISERRDLEAAYFAAASHEQRRIAQDLHDGLGQELTGLALLLSAVERSAAEAGLANSSDLAKVRDLASHTITTCRGVARGLLPMADAKGGLVAGLRDLVRRLAELPGPTIQFSVIEAASIGLSPAATDHLYRIAQEALTNALKHSHARAINVTLDVEPGSVLLSICDDGTGMRPPVTPAGGIGLKSMRYRADVIGARFSIQPRGAAGVCVVCECPQQA